MPRAGRPCPISHSNCVYLCTVAPATSVVLPSLVYWRVQRGFTQEQLAERLGMHRNTVWAIEAGHPAFMRTARLLAKTLRVQVADLQRQPPENYSTAAQ